MIAGHLRTGVIVFAGLLSLAAATDSNLLPATGRDNMRFQVENGLLTVNAHNVALSTLLFAIGEDAGFEVKIEGDFDTVVDVSFAGLPLEWGLKRLLERMSYLMFFDDSKKTA